MTAAAENVQIIIQARMGSERLPGKVMKSVLGKPLLEHLLQRTARARSAQGIIVATTVDPLDDVIERFCHERGTRCWRGSEQDVLSRYLDAARSVDATAVVRITADCPMIDPAVIDRLIAFFLTQSPRPDYASNVMEPRTYPRGMDCEIFSMRALEEASREAEDRSEREHVTPFLYRRPERFRLAGIRYVRDESRHRWTVDTPEDLELVRRLIEELAASGPDYTLEDALAAASRHPEWAQINSGIQQKQH